MSRDAEASLFEAYLIERPFSLFDFAERHFQGTSPIRRFLTLARQRNAKSLVVEIVDPLASIEAENERLQGMYSDYRSHPLVRLSFWVKEITSPDDIDNCEDDDCIGYALLKRDQIPSRDIDQWHIYEAVVRKYPHEHNYSHFLRSFPFRVGTKMFSVPGCLYAQQNGLNKACAQVALRSLLATRLGDSEISCEQINAYASEICPVTGGLNTAQISHVLERYNIRHLAIDYAHSESLKTDFPYEKLIYSGIESGAGSLLAFRMGGPNAPDVGHIIPCFGHTFNEDAWGPQAENAYFHIGESIQYIPSRAWCSSLIVHDDNFGANLCIPVSLLKPDQVIYAIELFPDRYQFSGAEAEVVSADYFYSLLTTLEDGEVAANVWIKRLLLHVRNQMLILRCVAVNREQYLDDLQSHTDWEGNVESSEIIESLQNQLPNEMWMVEVTIPEIFSTNKRKLGEILLDASRPLTTEIDGGSFILARFPECYVFFDRLNGCGEPNFLTARSCIRSHTQLLTRS